MKTFLPERLAILLLGAVGYGLTMARSLSFWDCGEYIAASNVLGIPHPPGNPLFVLLGRVFILLFGWINGPAFAVNLISAVSSVLCCLLIYEITTKILPKERKVFGFFAASVSLFGNTFWFNAVEAGSYGIAMMVIMLQIWGALKWKESGSVKYLIFVAYVAGLGMGFHTFCLLPLPVIFVWAVVTRLRNGIWMVGAIGLILIAFSVQIYLPVRSSTEPILNEYNPAKFENFRDVLGRKAYGDMSMFERALYRRGELLNQFGFSENIGYLGYHLNQWVPAPLGAQETGTWGKSFVEKMQFFHRIIFEFLIVAVFAGVWICRKNSSVVLAGFMFLISSVGLVIYLNLADGTRPDSYSAKQWNADIKELRKKVPDSIPNLPSLSKLNSQFSFYYNLPGDMRGAWLRSAPSAEGLRNVFAWEEALEERGEEMANPPRAVHREVRNRDYFFTPAFLFFAIMAAVACSAGVRGIKYAMMQKVMVVALAFAWVVPFACNFSTHNRSRDFIARNFAMNILSSVPQNGVLVTYGDNDTFPVWYMQMAENYRTDVVVINEALAYSYWYREQILKRHSDLIAPDEWEFIGGKKFIREIIENNWPERSVNFVIGANPDEYKIFSENMPLVGLVRNLGMEKAEADSLFVENLTKNYRYSEHEVRGQEANAQTIGLYRYLSKIALGNENAFDNRQNNK